MQLQLLAGRSESAKGVSPDLPIVVRDGSAARRRFRSGVRCRARSSSRPALCYTKIVPVDEVITLTLFYREDDHLRRLMLDQAQAAELDRLWAELHFVSSGRAHAGRCVSAAPGIRQPGRRSQAF